MLFYIVFFQKYSKKELFIIVPITALTYYSAKVSNYTQIFYTWLLITGAKNTAFDRIVKTSFFLYLFSIISLITLRFCGILTDAGIYRGDLFRPALGFLHPNTLGICLFVLIECWFYLRWDKLVTFDYLACIAVSIFSWMVPNSRTSSLCLVILAVLSFYSSKIFYKYEILSKITEYSLCVSAIICNIGSIILSILYNSKSAIMLTINKALSTRLSTAHQLFQEFGLSLLGQRIYTTVSERTFAGFGSTEIALDNSFMRILLHWGIVIYILFSLCILYLLIYCIKHKETRLFITLFTMIIYSVFERLIYMGTYCVFILALSSVIYENKSLNKNCNKETVYSLKALCGSEQ